MPGRCPVCHEKLDITRLNCPHCETSIEGRFEASKFDALTRDQSDFVEVFLKARGNIKEVERELGISYPTVRGRLEQVIQALGYRPEPIPDETASTAKRRDVLEALKSGRITAEEAVKLLKSRSAPPAEAGEGGPSDGEDAPRKSDEGGAQGVDAGQGGRE
jgi:hypothetical protein